MNYLLVFFGGGLGSLMRFGIWKLIGHYDHNFPWATFSSNALACLILGVLLGIQMKGSMADESKLFLMIGFCGGFSTFSTFSAETLRMFQYGSFITAASYIIGSLAICWICILIGIKIS